jgi:hypothetical protein
MYTEYIYIDFPKAKLQNTQLIALGGGRTKHLARESEDQRRHLKPVTARDPEPAESSSQSHIIVSNAVTL